MKPLVPKVTIKLQARIPLTTRARLVRVAEVDGITGTQAITDLIKEAHQEYFVKGESGDEKNS